MPIRRCVCPGSYDPVTLGHLDILERATALYDEVIVAVLHNPAKQGTFPVEQRLRLVQESLAPGLAATISVQAFADQLLVDVCREVGAQAIVKGLRGSTDFAYEVPMARMNRHLTGVETIFLPGDPALEHVSSSLIREVHRYGGDISDLVSAPVLAALRELE